MKLHNVAIAASILSAVAVVVWSCAGELNDIDAYRAGEGVQATCFGAETPPKFLTSSRCTQCHLSQGHGIGAALDLKSADVGTRLTGLVGSCPQLPLIDPANPKKSTLYQYVADQIDDCTYAKMPPTGASVSAADKHCLLTWIDGLDGNDDLHEDTEGGGGDGGPVGGDGGDTDTTDSMPTPTLQSLEDNIFGPICGTCHKAGTPPQGLILGPDLDVATLRANIVDVASHEAPTLKRIAPNDPNNSYLLLKVKGLQGGATCPTSCGVQMPKDMTPLTADQIAQIQAWVNAGAQ
jgi:hypothetical protein